jgi:hypothetical protein
MFIVTRDQNHIPSSDRSETAVLSPINGPGLGGLTLIYKHFVPPGLFPEQTPEVGANEASSNLKPDQYPTTKSVDEILLPGLTQKYSRSAREKSAAHQKQSDWPSAPH